MKIVDVIKYEGDNSTFVWKHPCEDFNSLTKLDRRRTRRFQLSIGRLPRDQRSKRLHRMGSHLPRIRQRGHPLYPHHFRFLHRRNVG